MEQDPIVPDSNIIEDITGRLYMGRVLPVNPITESEQFLL